MRGAAVVVAGLAVALVAASAGAAGSSAATALRPVSCATPTLRIAGFVQHQSPVVLRASRGSVGLGLQRPLRRLDARLFDYSGCIDTVHCTVGEPCVPPAQPPPTTTRVKVARIAGVRPRVAVADLAAANVLYVGRAGLRCLQRGRGTAFARCLRAASR